MGYVVLLMAAVYLIAYHATAFLLRLRSRTAAPSQAAGSSKAAGRTVRVAVSERRPLTLHRFGPT